jgi:hypothetical protein
MNDMPFNPPPPPPSVRKHSPLGIASFVLSILSAAMICAFITYAYILGSNSTSTVSMGASAVVWVFICAISLASLVGLGLGIAAVVQPGQSKVFGILGLVFNALILIGFCIFLLFAVFVAASAQGY